MAFLHEAKIYLNVFIKRRTVLFSHAKMRKLMYSLCHLPMPAVSALSKLNFL